jgi:hypothetical protein
LKLFFPLFYRNAGKTILVLKLCCSFYWRWVFM